jgi:hypothetical protein
MAACCRRATGGEAGDWQYRMAEGQASRPHARRSAAKLLTKDEARRIAATTPPDGSANEVDSLLQQAAPLGAPMAALRRAVIS